MGTVGLTKVDRIEAKESCTVMTVSSLSSCRHTASYSHENEEDLYYILEGERSNKDVLLPNYLYGIKQLTSIHVRKNGFGKS